MPRAKVHTIVAVLLLVLPLAATAQDASIDRLIKALKSNDAETQIRAARALGNMGAEAAPAAKALAEALASHNPDVESAAALALAALGPAAQSAVGTLVTELKDEDAPVRARAAFALGRIGDKSEATISALVKAALDSDVKVRRAVRDALRTLDAPREMTMPMWVQSLREADPRQVMPALLTLAELGPAAVPIVRDALKNEEACYWATLVAAELGEDGKELTPDLLLVLGHEDPECRMHALFALGEIGPGANGAAAAVIELLEDEKLNGVRYAAAYALTEIDDSDQTKAALAKLLDSDDAGLACIAGRGILRLDPDGPNRERAQKAVIAALMSEDDDIRHLAVRTLAEATPSDDPHQPAVVDAFMKAMTDADPVVVAEVIDALAAQGKRAVNRVVRGLESDQLRPIAVQVAIRMGPEAQDAVPALIASLDKTNDDPLLKREIHFALAAIGPTSAPAIPKLIEDLGDQFPEVRYSACYALGKIGPAASSAIPKLDALAKSGDDFQRLTSVWALVQIDPENQAVVKTAVPLLTEALTDSREHVRVEMANALGEIGPAAKSSLPALRAAVKDESPQVRAAAEKAIRQIQK